MHDREQEQATWRWWRIDAGGLAVCAVMAAAVYFTGVQPMLAQRAEAKRQREQLEAKRAEAADAVASLTALKRRLARTELELSRSPLRLQPVSAVNERISLITRLADESALQLNQIQPGQATSGRHYDTVPITLAGAGSYRDAVAFLHRLHTTFPDMGASAFELTGNPAVPGEPGRFGFTLAWFAAPVDHRGGE